MAEDKKGKDESPEEKRARLTREMDAKLAGVNDPEARRAIMREGQYRQTGSTVMGRGIETVEHAMSFLPQGPDVRAVVVEGSHVEHWQPLKGL